MKQILSPRESGEFIAKQAKFITVNENGVKELAKLISQKLVNGSLRMSGFSQCEVHPKEANENALNWIFLVDTLNFCFWSYEEKKWQVLWRGKLYTGYFALCAAVNRAIDEGYPITNPEYYSKIELDDLKTILRGDGDSIEVPLVEERQKCLHQVGQTLLEKYNGSFKNCITESDQSAEKLLQIIVENFSCYRDEGQFESVNVSFYKRAQILIGDIWVCFSGNGLGSFRDIDKLTMFADYRVPQVLVHFNVIKYSSELMDNLKKGVILRNGSREEMEIRGCSIHVVELVKNEIRKLLPNAKSNVGNESGDIVCNSILIDHFLWDYRREHASELETIPFHKTLSIYY